MATCSLTPSTRISKSSQTMTVLFKTPICRDAASRTATLHVALLAYYSRVVERLVKANLQHTPKRIVSAISFDDETVDPRDVALLVEWCYTGSLSSLSKMCTPAELAEAAAEAEAEDHDDADVDGEGESSGDDEGEGDDENGKGKGKAKAKGKRKATAKKTKAQKRQKTTASSDTGIEIPLFAAGATVERLYCIAADLEMPEFANYCMRLVMAKYSWNFFSPKKNLANRKKDTILDFAYKESRVPFKLMLRDAPFAPEGIHFIARHCVQPAADAGSKDGNDKDKDKTHKKVSHSRETRYLLKRYIRDVFAQRNPFKSLAHVQHAGRMKDKWKELLLADEQFQKSITGFWGDSHELSSQGALSAAAKLLNWPRYMIEERVQLRDGRAMGPGPASSTPKLARRDPEVFWQELDLLHITQVIVEECVEDSTLRSRDDDRHLAQWQRREEKNADHILKIVVRAVFAEKRDVSAFRFGDF